jgi:L-ascorbate metabolism protein UlaG (beta-lactamase superfamily)
MGKIRARAVAIALACALGALTIVPRANASPPAEAYFEPVRHDPPQATGARLSVLWIGHATVLVQMDDKWILTDPFLTERMGLIQRRLVDPALSVAEMPRIDAVLISHLHHDHLSLGSLKRIERKVSRLFVPQGGLVYIPNFGFDARELRTWQSSESDGLRITAVPVHHAGGRYGLDSKWMSKSFTGYVIEYHGLSVFFGGDTSYDGRDFKLEGQRFPHLDLAILPIAPIHPSPRMRLMHMNPDEALDAFQDLGASRMVPIHFDTLRSGDGPGEARERLVSLARARGVGDRVQVLRVGERSVIVPM